LIAEFLEAMRVDSEIERPIPIGYIDGRCDTLGDRLCSLLIAGPVVSMLVTCLA